MTFYFLDSSALVKRYVTEQGSGWIRKIVAPGAGHTIFIAHITPAEVVSALMRRKREGNLDQRTAHAARVYIDRHALREYQIIRLSDAIVKRAEDVLEQHALRSADAIQLASVLEVNSLLSTAGLLPLTFVGSDDRLLSAANMEGLVTNNPKQHLSS